MIKDIRTWERSEPFVIDSFEIEDGIIMEFVGEDKISVMVDWKKLQRSPERSVSNRYIESLLRFTVDHYDGSFSTTDLIRRSSGIPLLRRFLTEINDGEMPDVKRLGSILSSKRNMKFGRYKLSTAVSSNNRHVWVVMSY